MLKIDNTGKLFAPIGVVCPEITSLTNSIATTNTTLLDNIDNTADNTEKLEEQDTIKTHVDHILTVLNDASEATKAVNNSLVKRDNSNGTAFSKISVSQVAEIGETVAMYGDANVQWIPQKTVNGVIINDPKAICRLGRNHEEIVQDPTGDGLELVGLLPLDGIGVRNTVMITASTNPLF